MNKRHKKNCFSWIFFCMCCKSFKLWYVMRKREKLNPKHSLAYWTYASNMTKIFFPLFIWFFCIWPTKKSRENNITLNPKWFFILFSVYHSFRLMIRKIHDKQRENIQIQMIVFVYNEWIYIFSTILLALFESHFYHFCCWLVASIWFYFFCVLSMTW